MPLNIGSYRCLLLWCLAKAFSVVGTLGVIYEFVSTYSYPDSSLHVGCFRAFVIFGILGFVGGSISLLIWSVLSTKRLNIKLKAILAVLGALLAGLAMNDFVSFFISIYQPAVAFGTLLMGEQRTIYYVLTIKMIPELLGAIVALQTLSQKKQWYRFTQWFLDSQKQQMQ